MAEGKETIEHGAVLTDVEALNGARVEDTQFSSGGCEEGDVVIEVEAADVNLRGQVGVGDLEEVVEGIVD